MIISKRELYLKTKETCDKLSSDKDKDVLELLLLHNELLLSNIEYENRNNTNIRWDFTYDGKFYSTYPIKYNAITDELVFIVDDMELVILKSKLK